MKNKIYKPNDLIDMYCTFIPCNECPIKDECDKGMKDKLNKDVEENINE